MLTPAIETDRATVYQSTWLELAATLPTNMPGASLAIVDGPYNMKKADWDTFKSWDHFRDWYRPELEELTRVLDSSANVYVWGTDTSASALRPIMAELGWRRRTRIIWDKVNSASMLGWRAMDCWIDVVEVADYYSRGSAGVFLNTAEDSNVWRLPEIGWRSERLSSGMTTRGGLIERRAMVHPSQKPLAFYDRLIRSSSRVGDTVLEPYGGTLRAAVACQRLPPDEARRAIVCEPHGPYIEAVRPSLEFVAAEVGAQPSLFGGGQ